MGERDSVVIEQEKKWSIDYEELLKRNKYLIEENRNLYQENEKLREIFRIGVIEFEERERRIKFLKEELEKANQEIKRLKEENERLRKRIKELEGKNRILKKIAFGKKSEKRQEEKNKTNKKRGREQGHKGTGRKIPENLPIEEEIIEIPEEERHCEICGAPLIETGMEEISREVCVEKRYYIKVIKRKKYKKSCNCSHPIITADAPNKLIPKSKFSLSFWVDILINKYKNHMPVERQVSDMREYGVIVKSGTIFGGLKKIYFEYIAGLYQEMIKSIKGKNHFYSDESGWHLFVKIDKKGNYNWFVWVFISLDIAVFVLDPTRSAKVPLKVLFDIDKSQIKRLKDVEIEDKKIMTVDKFSSYKLLENMGLVELSYCWAHQRREFIDAKTKYPEIREWADTWIEKIAELYHINNKRIRYDKGNLEFIKYDKKLREKIEQIHFLINQQYSHPGQKEIMESMKKHWKGLTLFVDNPEIPMDNNIAERMLRPVVLGRKNYWGNHSIWGCNLSMAMFSIIQSCILNNISPRKYLTWYFQECIKKQPKDKIQIEKLLPHKLEGEIKNNLTMEPP
jgi:Transposase IS66 family.